MEFCLGYNQEIYQLCLLSLLKSVDKENIPYSSICHNMPTQLQYNTVVTYHSEIHKFQQFTEKGILEKGVVISLHYEQ